MPICCCLQDISHDQLLQRVSEVTSIPRHQQVSHTDLLLNTSDAQEMMDLSESLFSSLRHPFDFPSSKELCKWWFEENIIWGLKMLLNIKRVTA